MPPPTRAAGRVWWRTNAEDSVLDWGCLKRQIPSVAGDTREQWEAAKAAFRASASAQDWDTLLDAYLDFHEARGQSNGLTLEEVQYWSGGYQVLQVSPSTCSSVLIERTDRSTGIPEFQRFRVRGPEHDDLSEAAAFDAIHNENDRMSGMVTVIRTAFSDPGMEIGSIPGVGSQIYWQFAERNGDERVIEIYGLTGARRTSVQNQADILYPGLVRVV